MVANWRSDCECGGQRVCLGVLCLDVFLKKTGKIQRAMLLDLVHIINDAEKKEDFLSCS